MTAVDDEAFSCLMDSVDPPLVVVTTAADGERGGCLVGFHAQSSIDSEHYSVWLSKANHTYRLGLRAQRFAVHFLTAQDLSLAETFGTRCGAETDKFADLTVDIDEHGVPLLRDCPNRLLLERIAVLDDGGDHVCLTTRVVSAVSSGPFTPLRVSDADGLEPGHAAEERAVAP
ncbi:oxidoreductase [Aeromicrobium flavum]|uniref:Oxidoreductase n=1 Tax=Aeromicrobium flavum TaxID=416568 RepID=A0A512HVX5_9ACTN|nr:flavin reductase [Aeromicrobium flavum]GEO89602.1 oxidoreductase [Aeromicrobium flavum]